MLVSGEAEAPDVVLWDGVAALEQGESDALQAPVLALVANESEVAPLLAMGVQSALYQDASDEQLLAALHAAALGLAVLDPDFSAALAAPPLDESLEALTPREEDVLALLAEGLANKAIAKRLELSEHTVKFHLSALLGKFGVASRTELVVRAIQVGRVSL